jgi:hypothetical protein
MGTIVIHPGEHLARELEALDRSAAELARKIDVPTNRITQIMKGTRGVTRRYGAAACSFFWHERAVLAQFTESL